MFVFLFVEKSVKPAARTGVDNQCLLYTPAFAFAYIVAGDSMNNDLFRKEKLKLKPHLASSQKKENPYRLRS